MVGSMKEDTTWRLVADDRGVCQPWDFGKTGECTMYHVSAMENLVYLFGYIVLYSFGDPQPMQTDQSIDDVVRTLEDEVQP